MTAPMTALEVAEVARGAPAGRSPWWRVALPVRRSSGTQELCADAEAILAAVRAYLADPEWAVLDDEERTDLIHTAVVPLWEPEDAERLMQAVADVDGALRAEDDVLEEIAAALRDGTDPSLELHTVTPDVACEFIRQHHRHLPECNRRGIVHALAARWRGQIVAVATAGAPTGRWGRASACPPEGTLEITRVASIAGLRRYDRRGRQVPVGAASALVAHLIDLLPTSGRGAPGCRLITYQLTAEDGAIYRALVSKGLRPVALSDHRQAGGAREHVALAGAKVRWEAGPAAGAPDWNLLQPQHRPGARAAFAAFAARAAPARRDAAMSKNILELSAEERLTEVIARWRASALTHHPAATIDRLIATRRRDMAWLLAQAQASRGLLPATAQEFGAYAALVKRARKWDAEPDDKIVARLLAHERNAVTLLTTEFITHRSASLLLRGAGWDAVPLLLKRSALAVVAEEQIAAVLDDHDRIGLHPNLGAALKKRLHDAVRRAQDRAHGLRGHSRRMDGPAVGPVTLQKVASLMWERARKESSP